MASILKHYPGARIQFRDRLGNAAAVDTSTKPVRIELDPGSEVVAGFTEPLATGEVGAFTTDVSTLSPGICSGAIVADKDMTPEGEDELRVPFAFTVDPAPAANAGFDLGAGVDK